MSYMHRLRRITCKRLPLFYMLAFVLELMPAFSAESPPITLRGDPVTLRGGPGEQHAIVATLPPALVLELTVIDERGEWSKVRVASGQEGWLRLGALAAGTPASSLGLGRSPAPASPAPTPTPPVADRPSQSGPMHPSTIPAGESSSIALRAGPGEQHAIVATLPPALVLELTIIDERGEWSKARVASGQEGWLRLGALAAGAPASSLGLDRSSAPASPASPPTPPVADRPLERTPTPVAPPLATATTERLPEPASPRPAVLSPPPPADRLPEPTPARPLDRPHASPYKPTL